eukprot:GHVN01041326.1.p1 GENE.GHVN01041326.1~~GHVN01041326.1.p1  ORF type:complete len:339 (-),score=23.90 GHVN01041326.1:143-1159(-)
MSEYVGLSNGHAPACDSSPAAFQQINPGDGNEVASNGFGDEQGDESRIRGRSGDRSTPRRRNVHATGGAPDAAPEETVPVASQGPHSLEPSERTSGLSGFHSQNLQIRSFTTNDATAVKAIFKEHVRSLTPRLMLHYITQQGVDLCVILLLVKLFVSWPQLLCIWGLLLLYIFGRAHWELESYLRKECRDMHDINNAYMEDEKSHIWVAEESYKDKQSHREASRLLGCVGVTPYKGDHSIAQLVRLVVSQESRRMRMGSRLANQVEDFALRKGYREVRTYTNNLNPSATKFLRQAGYEQVQVMKRGLMRGDLFLWRKILSKQSEPETRRGSASFGVFD